MKRQRVISVGTVLAERAKGNPDRAAVPVGAVCVCDEAQLVNAGDEGAEEEHVDEGDEYCGALGCAKAD